MDTISNVAKRTEQKKKYVTWKDIELLVDKFIEKIKETNNKPKLIYSIPRGGLIPGVLISYKLNIPLINDVPEIKDIEHVLIVDDIADSGKTLKKIIENKKNPQIYTLFYKKKSKVKPRWFGEEVAEEEWIVFPWEE